MNEDVAMDHTPEIRAAIIRAGKRKRSPPPGPEEAESSSSVIASRSEAAVQSTNDDERPAQRVRRQEASSTRPRTRAAMEAKKLKEKRPSDWHMTKKEVPQHAKKTKEALDLHIRALWCLPQQNAIPPAVSGADRAAYASRFTSEDQVRTSVRHSLTVNAPSISKAEERLTALKALFSSTSTISGSMKKIPESLLLFAFRVVSTFGLLRWAPDVLSGDPESMYNLLHEYIALNTFEQLAIAGAYSHIGINMAAVRDFSLMRRCYRSFTFSYLRTIAKMEVKRPGAVKESHERENAVKRRNELADKRVQQLMAEAFHNDFIWSVNEPAGHSDDEPDDGNEDGELIYEIGKVEGRSEKYTNFYHSLLDPRTRTAQRKKGRHKKQDRPRITLQPQRPSRFNGEPLPDRVCIDYFEPKFWNHELSVEDKANYIKAGIFIGMPPAYLCTQWKDVLSWKGLSCEEMKEKYGAAVLRDYVMPTEEELQQLRDIQERKEDDRQAAQEQREETEVEEELSDVQPSRN